MRTFSFFNEKGGVGKSVHTVMFASYLAYSCGAKVLVLDFENPYPRLADMRKQELDLLDDPESALSRYFRNNPRPRDFYMIQAPLKDMRFAYDQQNAADLREDIWRLIRSSAFDYILFDFPGILIQNSPAFDCCVSGQIDLVAVPFDTEPMTRKAAMTTCSFLQKCGTDVVAFWNNVSSAELSAKGFLDVGEVLFNRFKVPVMADRIKSFAKARRDSTGNLFVRSSLCWPQRYVEMACPALEGLYASLKLRLDGKR